MERMLFQLVLRNVLTFTIVFIFEIGKIWDKKTTERGRTLSDFLISSGVALEQNSVEWNLRSRAWESQMVGGRWEEYDLIHNRLEMFPQSSKYDENCRGGNVLMIVLQAV